MIIPLNTFGQEHNYRPDVVGIFNCILLKEKVWFLTKV